MRNRRPVRHVLDVAGRRLQRYKRPTAGIWYNPDDESFAATADHVVDDPREPRLIPTGVLDHNGEMLIRVVFPIKVKMGFHTGAQSVQDEVTTIVPESLLHVAEDMAGEGIAYIDEAELGPEDDEEDGDEP